MSFQGRGTASEPEPWIDLGETGSGGSIGYLAVVPEEFTRKELQALLRKARALAQYGIFDDTKRELLECMAEDLDALDALAARNDADLAELNETITEHSAPSGVTINNAPYCDCPCHLRIYGHGVGD